MYAVSNPAAAVAASAPRPRLRGLRARGRKRQVSNIVESSRSGDVGRGLDGDTGNPRCRTIPGGAVNCSTSSARAGRRLFCDVVSDALLRSVRPRFRGRGQERGHGLRLWLVSVSSRSAACSPSTAPRSDREPTTPTNRARPPRGRPRMPPSSPYCASSSQRTSQERLYGYKKMWPYLRRRHPELGPVARCTVRRLMKSEGIEYFTRLKRVRTKVVDKAPPGREPGRPQLHRYRAEPPVDRRLHLCQRVGRHRLRRLRRRRVRADDPRMAVPTATTTGLVLVLVLDTVRWRCGTVNAREARSIRD